MKVDVETVGSFQKRLVFEVPPDQVATRLESAYKRLASSVRLAGFRPGKAPRQVLEAKFSDRVEADVANDIIQQSYQTALANHAIKPVSAPNLADASPVAEPTGFRFTITVDVRPEIALTKWTGMDVVYPKVEVPEADVERAISARLEGQAKLEEVADRAVQQGDLALVELKVTEAEGGAEVASEPGTMIRTEGDPYYPGLEAVVVGLGVGEQREAEVRFGDKARVEAIAGRTLNASVKVMQIQSYRVPELTDEIAGTLGYEGGAAGMRTAIEAQIRQGRDELARNQARANLLERVIADNPFEVPSSMIEQSLKMLMDELRQQQAMRTGRDPRTIGFSEAQVQDLRMRADFAAKAGLILEWVSRTEGIEVTDADADAKFVQLASERGQTVEAVRGWFQKGEALTELKERILEEKTLDWLLERANLVDALTTPAATAASTSSTSGGDTAILDGKIDDLKEALAAGKLDDQLDALLAAETAGRNRKGALGAIEARRKEIVGG